MTTGTANAYVFVWKKIMYRRYNRKLRRAFPNEISKLLISKKSDSLSKRRDDALQSVAKRRLGSVTCYRKSGGELDRTLSFRVEVEDGVVGSER